MKMTSELVIITIITMVVFAYTALMMVYIDKKLEHHRRIMIEFLQKICK